MPHLHRLILSLALGLSPSAILAAPPSYSLTPILLDPSAGGVGVNSINNAGQMAVTVSNPAVYGSTSVRLDPDGTVTACGPTYAEAFSMLPDGRVLSDYDAPNGRIGITVGNSGQYQTLVYPAGFPTNAFFNAAAGDCQGTVVGTVDYNLVTWSGSNLSPTVIGKFAGQATQGTAISKNGQYIVGVTGPDDETTPFVYSDGAFTAIDTPGFTDAQATGVNNNGTVIGFAIDFPNNLRRGFTWRDGVLSWLDPVGSLIYSDPDSINDNGLIVGTNGLQAMLWDLSGGAYQLNDLASVDTSRTDLGYAYSINDSNQIVGSGDSLDIDGVGFSYLLNPIAVPEPASAAVLLAAFPLLAARRNYGRRK